MFESGPLGLCHVVLVIYQRVLYINNIWCDSTSRPLNGLKTESWLGCQKTKRDQWRIKSILSWKKEQMSMSQLVDPLMIHKSNKTPIIKSVMHQRKKSKFRFLCFLIDINIPSSMISNFQLTPFSFLAPQIQQKYLFY